MRLVESEYQYNTVTGPRVLCLAMTYDYGLPARGYGYEYYNMLPAIDGLFDNCLQFDFAEEIRQNGYWTAQTRLRQVIEGWRPDALFFITYKEQIDRELMCWITDCTPTVTIGWFSDDHWRFDGFSSHWAKALNWVVTTDLQAVERYRRLGQTNVILSQWAANEHVYRPTGSGLKYDVTFVGQAYGSRVKWVEYLRAQGFDARAWGPGWPSGRLSQEEMVDIFSSSKVNLNFAESSVVLRNHFRPPPQIKGRVFEVPACGGLLMTEYAAGMERYYDIGNEIVTFKNKRDIVKKMQSLLADESIRSKMATAAYFRTMRDHTWSSRLREVFLTVGIQPRGPIGA